MGSTRRTILAAGAAAAAAAAVPRVFAQQAAKAGTGKFYEKGPVRIYYEEAGSGFPLMLLPGGGLNSTIAGFKGGNPLSRHRGVQGTVPLHHGGPAQRALRPVDRPRRSRPAVGFLRRRPPRPDGSSGHRQVHGDGLLHWRPLHLESLEARAQSRCRGRDWRSPWGGVRRCATLNTRAHSGHLGCGADRPAARDHAGDDREIRDEYVRDQPRFRLHGDAGFRAQLPEPGAGPAGRSPGASLRRRHGVRDARAESRSEHLPLERAQGADSLGGAPNPFVPQGASARLVLSPLDGNHARQGSGFPGVDGQDEHTIFLNIMGLNHAARLAA